MAARGTKRQQFLIQILRTVIIAAGLYQLLFGEREIGLCIALSYGAIMLPNFFTRGRIKAVPVEFEMVLFLMVFLQFVIGETLNFYENVPYYDKFVHFSIPFFLGYITSMVVYTLMVVQKWRMSPGVTVFVVVLMTLGIGAAWEIFEYASDQLLGTYLQGSLTANPLVDTMNDLIVDTLGGVFGSLLALRFIRAGRAQPGSRLEQMTTEIADDLSMPKRV